MVLTPAETGSLMGGPVSASFIEDYEYQVVHDYWRKASRPKRKKKNLPVVTAPLILDLLAGKTIAVKHDGNLQPFKNLYATLYTRGFQLRMYQHDRLFMWAERINDENEFYPAGNWSYPRPETE